jgi:hypothetical protein
MYHPGMSAQRNRRPGLWEKRPPGQGRTVEQGHQEEGTAPATGTDHLQACGMPLAALPAQSAQPVEPRAARSARHRRGARAPRR